MRWLLKGKFKLFQEQKGFTLFEVLVVVGILGALGVGLLTALDANSRANRTLDEQTTAMNLATTYLEDTRELPYQEPPYSDNYSSAGDNINIPSQYRVVISTKYSSNGETFGSYTGNETLQLIRISISREGGKPVLSMCTFKYKPGGS